MTLNFTKCNFTAPESKPYKEVKMNKPGPNAAMTNVGQVILTLSKRTYQRFGNPHFYATVVTVPNVHSILSSAVGGVTNNWWH